MVTLHVTWILQISMKKDNKFTNIFRDYNLIDYTWFLISIAKINSNCINKSLKKTQIMS